LESSQIFKKFWVFSECSDIRFATVYSGVLPPLGFIGNEGGIDRVYEDWPGKTPAHGQPTPGSMARRLIVKMVEGREVSALVAIVERSNELV
jgi:hypothetical protein